MNASNTSNVTIDDVISEANCDKWRSLLGSFNHYFRNEPVINGTDHAPVVTGDVIVSLYVFVFLMGSGGNLLTFAALLRNPQMRSNNRNLFIFNLALSDCFMCTITAPMTLYTVLYFFWPFGVAFCKLAGSLQGFNIFVSTFSIAAIGLDRYVAIIFPTRRASQRYFMFCCFIAIWTVSFVLAVPLLIASHLKPIHHDHQCQLYYDICHEQNDIWQRMLIGKETYTVSVLFIQYCLPLTSLVFAYAQIASRMQTRIRGRSSVSVTGQRRRSVVDRQRRTNLLLMSIVGVFAVSWLPLNIFHIVNTFKLSKGFNVPTFAVCHVIGMLSACANPVLYGVLNENFRVEFVAILNKIYILPAVMSLKRLFTRLLIVCSTNVDEKTITGNANGPLLQPQSPTALTSSTNGGHHVFSLFSMKRPFMRKRKLSSRTVFDPDKGPSTRSDQVVALTEEDASSGRSADDCELLTMDGNVVMDAKTIHLEDLTITVNTV